MYFVPKYDQNENMQQEEKTRNAERKLRFIGSSDYDEALESSFLFEPEGSGFYSVKNSRKKTGKSVFANKSTPLAAF